MIDLAMMGLGAFILGFSFGGRYSAHISNKIIHRWIDCAMGYRDQADIWRNNAKQWEVAANMAAEEATRLVELDAARVALEQHKNGATH